MHISVNIVFKNYHMFFILIYNFET